LDRIADAACGERVPAAIEIGAGRGALTEPLLERADRVIAIEVDAVLVHYLRQKFHEAIAAGHLELNEGDVLKADFATAAERPVIAGNLPYYITSPILLKLAANHAVLDRAVLMVQREVADRVTASPGSRDYGLLSVTVQMYGPAQALFTLPPSAFSPPPDVHSSVFRWRFAPRFEELGVEEADFLPFVRQVFAQKRKTLSNNLRAAGYGASDIEGALNAASIAPQARAEELGIETLAALWNALKKKAAPAGEAASPIASSD
jgi:16S rRNA (adenine1518-N6/adenine1519-N6)-dimethyltransferase